MGTYYTIILPVSWVVIFMLQRIFEHYTKDVDS